jgi:hypothetical protein
VHDGVARRHAQHARHSWPSLLQPHQQRLGRGLEAALLEVVGEARQPPYLPAGAGHEGSSTGRPLQQAFGHQGVHRLAYGHPRDAEFLHQLALRRCRIASHTILYESADVLAHSDVLQRARRGGNEVFHDVTIRLV